MNTVIFMDCGRLKSDNIEMETFGNNFTRNEKSGKPLNIRLPDSIVTADEGT